METNALTIGVGHTEAVLAVATCPNETSNFLSCGKDQTVIYWHIESSEKGVKLRKVNSHFFKLFQILNYIPECLCCISYHILPFCTSRLLAVPVTHRTWERWRSPRSESFLLRRTVSSSCGRDRGRPSRASTTMLFKNFTLSERCWLIIRFKVIFN